MTPSAPVTPRQAGPAAHASIRCLRSGSAVRARDGCGLPRPQRSSIYIKAATDRRVGLGLSQSWSWSESERSWSSQFDATQQPMQLSSYGYCSRGTWKRQGAAGAELPLEERHRLISGFNHACRACPGSFPLIGSLYLFFLFIVLLSSYVE